MLNKNNEKIKFQNLKISSKVLSVLGLVYIFIGCLFISIFPQYSLSTENINLTARCTYTFASIIGIIILYMYYTQSLTKLDNKIYISIAIIYLVIQFMQLQFIIQDLYKVNELDMITAKSVEQTIEEYEQTSGIEVKNVVYYKDKNSSNSYPNIINFGEINQKIITKRWRNLSVLGFFTGRDLQMQTSDEYENKEYEEYFSTKDWDYFDEEQLKFSGDTVYWCLF
jgi:hypothetical protein